MKLSASIVTYNSNPDVTQALESIEHIYCFHNLKVYVIDNCSTDNTVDFVKKRYPFVNVIETTKNGGYGYGHNQVIEKLTSDIHFIINPDIRFGITTLRETASFLLGRNDIAICTPEMRTSTGGYEFPPKQQPKIRYIVARFFSQFRFLQKWRDEYTMKEKVMNNNGNPFDISFCSGAFMAIKTAYFKQVGGFDDRYFLYYEDADLTRKLLKLGRCVCIPTLSVIHDGKRDAYKSALLRKIMIASMLKYFCKWGFFSSCFESLFSFSK